jgi:hypothetical protein
VSRSRFAALALLALPGPGPAAPVPTHLTKDLAFDFPTRVGTTWEYRSGKHRYELAVAKAQERDGAKLLSLFLLVGGCGSSGGTISVSAGRVTEAGPGRAPPRTLLVFPLRPGATWRDGGTTATVRGVEPVAVPAGRYDAVRVDEVTPAPGGAVTVTSWYATGVGLVRRARAVGDRCPEVVAELESFTSGKD